MAPRMASSSCSLSDDTDEAMKESEEATCDMAKLGLLGGEGVAPSESASVQKNTTPPQSSVVELRPLDM